MIDLALIHDVEEICNLVNLCYRGEASKKGWTTEANMLTGIRVSTEEISDIIRKHDSFIFKFTQNNIIISTVLLEIHDNQLYLGMLCVDPNLQNNGTGKKMLKFATDFAIKNNKNKIIMTVISERESLIKWYNRHGYIDNGKREPFPASHNKDVISGTKLEFVVLEKTINMH